MKKSVDDVDYVVVMNWGVVMTSARLRVSSFAFLPAQ